MRGFCKQRSWDWKRRGHPVYRLEQKRFPLFSTASTQAAKRTMEVTRGAVSFGSWDGTSGTGEGVMVRGSGVRRYGVFERPIKNGHWSGSWRREAR